VQWRKLHNEELCDLYPSPKFVRVIKSRRMRLAGHIARTGGEVYTEFLWGNMWERDHLKDRGVDGRIILRWEGGAEEWTALLKLRIGTGVGLLWMR